MGGGDLNTKKAWHPSNYKNQERVWKAEQAAAQEKKRIVELQRERAEERDREELNEIAKRTAGGGSSPNDNRLHWMYDKPDKKIQQEDYLLGKSIDAKGQADKGKHDVIPAVARRVVGSNVPAMSSDTQVDLARKLREDPLLLIKERERAARAALLNNPLQRRKLTELLRKEQDKSRERKEEKKAKKKHNDLDNILAAKLNALGAKKGVDLKTLLADDDSSSDSSSDSKQKKKKRDKKKKKKDKKKKKSKRCKDSDAFDDEIKCTRKEAKNVKTNNESGKDYKTQLKRKTTKSESEDDYDKTQVKKHRRDATTERNKDKETKQDERQPSDSIHDYRSSKQKSREHTERRHIESLEHKGKARVRMSEEEKAAKLAEMVAAGEEREVQRGRRVAEQLAEKEASERITKETRYSSRHEARALPDSLESRIHSNRHYIQRDRRHMNEHFARR